MASSLGGVYEKVVDRESAYEKLKGRAAEAGTRAGNAAGGGNGKVAAGTPAEEGGGLLGGLNDVLFGSTGPYTLRQPLLQTAKSAVLSHHEHHNWQGDLRGVLGGIFGGGSKRR